MSERKIEAFGENDPVDEAIADIIRTRIQPMFGEPVFVTVMIRACDSTDHDALNMVTNDPEMPEVFGIETLPEGVAVH